MPGTSSPGDQGKLVTDEFEDGLFQLVHDTRAADVFVDSSDWTVARISARDLTLDIQRVTGCKALLKHSRDNLSSHAVLVGTLGKSPVIDGLVQDGKIDVKDVRGQWETFAIAVVADPLPGVTQGLVIVGIFHNSGDHTIIP
ncbi:MAG: glycosyl hydrolase, partial [Planctomycetes bacterium]|nr:glycosyl hydrolase [Planctomycetota bacterium]